MAPVYENKYVRIEIETSEIPWLKIFVQASCKEMTDCDAETRRQIWTLLDLLEREMLSYFKPDKINIASFANYLPQVHWHIMARYKEDSYFPEPMWGKKQREADLDYPSMDLFIPKLLMRIDSLLK
jgi:diadenosine tetraphosphate (Ap4A) HIT family hydrolase